VLPILLAGGASGGARRPFAIVAGLVASFVTFTLVAAWLLDLLGLPKDLLRNLAIALLFLVAATLLVPRLGTLLERPLVALTRRRFGDAGGGLVLGLGLGLVFVPCAGPVLAYITVAAASRELDAKAVLLTVAYALGAAVPMLAVAVGGQRAARRFRAPALRPALGVVVAAAALAIVFSLDVRAQTALGDYTAWLQGGVERTDFAERQLSRGGISAAAAALGEGLPDFGPAPELRGIAEWVNTPGERALTLERLRGKVVLVDFWTYSCINCLRTLPHLKAWDAAYRDDGLVIIGVHSPEFSFEHVPSNVRGAVRRLGLRYAIALDNDFATWRAYANQYWPAKYLIDRRGHVRYAHFGEGAYDRTERLIRRLLAAPVAEDPVEPGLADATPTGHITAETYLGYQRLDRYAGSPVRDREARYRFPRSLVPHQLAYGGRWRVEEERSVAGADARLRLRFRARDIFLVLGGHGRVEVRVDGFPVRTVRVSGHRLYTLVDGTRIREALLELRADRGVEAYAFTFG
jgi:cytochrome c biogenesis protein CcdA/thiol-disulfide isomerase/thioredoxin